MAHELVVHIKKARYDQYCGRVKDAKFHYGNPFTHLPVRNTLAGIQVATREESIQAFDDWLEGVDWINVEPERRQWILDHIPDLKGKVLGCFCAPLDCHCDILAKRANDS